MRNFKSTGRGRGLLPLGMVVPMFLLTAAAAHAQQTTGAPCSSSATTSIDGKSLPSVPPGFGGVINMTARESKACWPPTVVPPKGAPNVLLIMTDDQGYGVSGTFDGVIPTPRNGSDRKRRAAVHPAPLHGIVLSNAGGLDYGSKSLLGGIRSNFGTVHGLPGL